MKRSCLAALLAIACLGGAHGQAIIPRKKKEVIYRTPLLVLEEKLGRKLSEQEFQDYHWNARNDTQRDDDMLRKDIVESESGPFLSRRSVWASETIVPRAAEFGGGKYSEEASSRVTPYDRWTASQMPEAGYPGKAQDDAILAAVYRYFFNYRKRGFGQDTTVYFLGIGPHAVDAPPSVLNALDSDPSLAKLGVTLRPMSKLLEVTEEAMRDRDTGAYGVAFRVDSISPVTDGEVKVTAAFSERDGFWFARQLTLWQGKSGWEVVKDDDMPSPTAR